MSDVAVLPSTWLRNYQIALVGLDGVLLTAAVAAAAALRFPDGRGDLKGLSYFLVAAVIGALWWSALALTRSYESRYLAEGPEEFRRVSQATVRLSAVLGVICYVTHLPLSRGFVAAVLPIGALFLMLGRGIARRVLRVRRRAGAWTHRVVVVGASRDVEELSVELGRNVGAGLEVVAAALPHDDGSLDLLELEALVRGTGADTVAVTAWPGMAPSALRELSYAVEGAGVDMLVAPSLVNVSGSRVSMRAIAGIPLLQLREVELTGAARVVKSASDRFFASVGVVLLSPLLLLVALAVRLTSSGPVLVKERRLGAAGSYFNQLRFRTRHPAPPWDGVDRRGQRQTDQPHTPVGAVLERAFLDHLPTLFNVVRGEMALVGPRPMRPGRRQSDPLEQRRLLVRPGITGLAQVTDAHKGSIEESLRLDQQYVDNWSPWMDALIIVKTLLLLGRGRRLS